MNEEEKKAIEYYQDKEISFTVDIDKEKFLEALGITEEDSFENHQIRFKTLLNLIEKQNKIIDLMAKDYYELFKVRPGTLDKFFNHEVCLWEDCDNINREVNCDYCIKELYRKKVINNE